jgi:transposase
MKNTLLIPSDLSACQALLAEMARTMAVQDEKIIALEQRLDERERYITELLRRAFEKRSERYLEDPNQLTLDFGEKAADAADGLADAINEAKQVIVPEHLRRTHVTRKPRNEQLPAHLERRDVDAVVPVEMRFCATHGERKIIGYDYVETLMFEQPKLWVRRLAIPKFACERAPQCGIAEPSRAPGLVEGNRYDTSVAAQIVTMKFGYHLPIYRHQDIFASSGWTPQRSTLLNIAEAAGDLLAPLIDHLRTVILGSGMIGTDDTRVTLLLPKFLPDVIKDDAKSKRIHDVFQAARNEKRPSVSGRMWAYRSMTVKLSVFDFTVSRHRDGPDEFLIDSGYKGTILADCYSGYQGITLRSDGQIVRAACHAHARRKVFDARDNHPLLASQLLADYQRLYDVEDRARGKTEAERLALRQSESRPIWEGIQKLIQGETAAQVLPKEKIQEALTYMRNQSAALETFLSDGRVPIDNNEVEQLMKTIERDCTGKFWLFAGLLGHYSCDFGPVGSSGMAKPTRSGRNRMSESSKRSGRCCRRIVLLSS